MSLTKEMMFQVENEIQLFDNQSLINYYITHNQLNNQYPNSYYKFKAQSALEEIINRGIEENIMEINLSAE